MRLLLLLLLRLLVLLLLLGFGIGCCLRLLTCYPKPKIRLAHLWFLIF